MTKEDLFKKYSIDETHSEWNQLDNWYSVEIYKIIRGKLPEKGDLSTDWILEFKDKIKIDFKWWLEIIENR